MLPKRKKSNAHPMKRNPKVKAYKSPLMVLPT